MIYFSVHLRREELKLNKVIMIQLDLTKGKDFSLAKQEHSGSNIKNH